MAWRGSFLDLKASYALLYFCLASRRVTSFGYFPRVMAASFPLILYLI